MSKLTRKQTEMLALLGNCKKGANAYDLAGRLFGERYGIFASRTRGRLRVLQRLGFAKSALGSGIWHITPSGRSALGEQPEVKE